MAKKGRKTGISVSYNGKNLTKKLKGYIEEFSYTDVASGECDSIEMTLNNRDRRFMNKNKPYKGDKISASISIHNWQKNGQTKSCKCGRFVLDDLSFTEPPLTCNIGAVSMPVKGEFKSRKRTKTYKNVTLREIAKTIANRAGIALHYSADRIHIKEIEQSKTSDSEFLQSLCEEYGLGLKIYRGKIVIFDEEDYEKKAPACTLRRKKDIVTWTWNTTLQGTYTGAKVTYTDSDDNKTHHVTVGKKGRLLDVNVTAFSKKDAGLKAKAKLANENKKQTTMTLTIFPNPKIIATSTIRISGLYKLSGKYYVDKVTHTVNRSGGYLMMLEVHKVKSRAGLSVAKSSNGSGGMSVYVVKRGDTLALIAKRQLGNVKYGSMVYSQNKDVIEKAAKKAGKGSSNNGKVLIPGTKLKISS